MSFVGLDPRERLARFIAESAGEGLVVTGVEALAGDASNRAYYRMRVEGGDDLVAALLPSPFEPSTLPFLNVAELFEAIPIRVPRVLRVSGAEGILVLEDLGNRLLQDEVDDAAEDSKVELYNDAIDLLAKLQLRGAELDSDRYVCFRTAFDEAKFVEELEFFREHFLAGLRKCALDESSRERLSGHFRAIARELCEQPFALCHRDYHARNLMLVNDELVVIDFQDARRGPRSYDLVSLLNDSYVPHSAELVDEMTHRFEHAIGASMRPEYDVNALQRNLKALGTFGFQISVRGNDVYERYIAPTLGLVRTNLERNPRWDPLRRILAQHVEEVG